MSRRRRNEQQAQRLPCPITAAALARYRYIRTHHRIHEQIGSVRPGRRRYRYAALPQPMEDFAHVPIERYPVVVSTTWGRELRCRVECECPQRTGSDTCLGVHLSHHPGGGWELSRRMFTSGTSTTTEVRKERAIRTIDMRVYPQIPESVAAVSAMIRIRGGPTRSAGLKRVTY